MSSLTCGRPTLILAPPKPCAFALSASSTSALRFDMQPAALGGIDRHGGLCAAGLLPERPARGEAFGVPQGGIDGGQRKAGDGADRGRMGREKQALPDRLDVERIAAEQPRRQMIPEQSHDRRAAGADRVAVAGADDAVAGVDPHHRRFLRGKRLDRVGAHRLWNQIDLQDFDALDLGHGFPFIFYWAMLV